MTEARDREVARAAWEQLTSGERAEVTTAIRDHDGEISGELHERLRSLGLPHNSISVSWEARSGAHRFLVPNTLKQYLQEIDEV